MSSQIQRLIDIVEQLRAPEGCPWDKEQTHKSIQSGLLDEVYELFEAVEEDDSKKIKEELGDILLQVVFHSQMAKEENKFTFEDVAKDISDKLVRRHPHVFGTQEVSSSEEVIRNWEQIKKNEAGKEHRKYYVDDIAAALPALFRAEKMQRRVAKAGFDWKEVKPVLDKVEEEFSEFREAILECDRDHASEELGDILFALVNVARHYKICAEDALRATTYKFANRFRYIEDKFKELNKDINTASLQEMENYWQESKKYTK
ncbi:nucleoside triphosphate pyrophosphohydrolase [Chitinispirillales bacterium ANBcel5]|uniref:nucleoside triphosphate pyrophosphohydrolase n=1 Tax=Cellulosispirillum alkaliphilum TaxID=3039283 RepID=UPI002A4E4A30|nr:nucleoside triphosphate pyrophosphohydrolase [Chitinispirillales bacterium ANBcel5]